MIIDVILTILLCLLFFKLAINIYEKVFYNINDIRYIFLITQMLFVTLFTASIFGMMYYIIYKLWIAN